MRAVQTVEYIRTNGLSSLFKEVFYRNRKAVIFEKDLTETRDRTGELTALGAVLIEIDRAVITEKKYTYRFRNRQLKALRYLEQGYSGFGVVKGAEIVGEMWYCTHDRNDGPRKHRDLAWLGIRLNRNEVYAFDWFVVPQDRGRNLSGLFQQQALHGLQRKGYAKAFAYVWADNTPAFWSTRYVNKWKEVRTEKMTRFLISRMNESRPGPVKVPMQPGN